MTSTTPKTSSVAQNHSILVRTSHLLNPNETHFSPLTNSYEIQLKITAFSLIIIHHFHHPSKNSQNFHTQLQNPQKSQFHIVRRMDFWAKARTFAEEAAKKSQELTLEAAKRSQELTSSFGNSSKIADIVSETAKKSKELAAEASNHIRAEALKRADQIKALNLLDSSNLTADQSNEVSSDELVRFGITDELREFVKEITMSTFQDFPLPDDAPMTDVPTVSNVRQDLTEWQARHASLMLSTVKEISKLRYELCPRHMKERKFWRIYFMLVNSHIAPYEQSYNEEAKLKVTEEEKAKAEKEKNAVKSVSVSKPDGAEPTQPLKKATSSAEQDLDVFLLGDLGDSDDGRDDRDDGGDDFDDDFDKIDDSSEDERAKDTKK